MAAGALSLLITVLLMRTPWGSWDRLRPHAGDADHPLERAQLLDHAGQMHTVMHTDHQLDHADAAIALVHADLLDIAIGGIDAAGEQGNQAALVFQLHADRKSVV